MSRDAVRITLELDLAGAERDLDSCLRDLISRAERMREDLAAKERLETTLMKNRADVDVLADRVNRCRTLMAMLGEEAQPAPAGVSSPAPRVPAGGGRRR